MFNALVGEKLAAVSLKPQTTRGRLRGILHEDDAEFIFVDTPGFQEKVAEENLLNKMMNKAAFSSLKDADIVIYLIDASRGWQANDTQLLGKMAEKNRKKILIALSKTDRIIKARVKENKKIIMAQLEELNFPKSSIDISAKVKTSLIPLKQKMKELLPEGPWHYEEGDLTNLPEKNICAEYVREQLFRQLGQEVPYCCSVKIDQLTHQANKVIIDCTLVLSKDSLKPMLIGKKGTTVQKIREASEVSLTKFFSKPAQLHIFVKVDKNWQNNLSSLIEMENFIEE